jgi:hypothetical protein
MSTHPNALLPSQERPSEPLTVARVALEKSRKAPGARLGLFASLAFFAFFAALVDFLPVARGRIQPGRKRVKADTASKRRKAERQGWIAT